MATLSPLFRRVVFFLAAFGCSGLTFSSNLVVVVNPESGLESMSREQVIHLFMGRLKQLPSGSTASVLDVTPYKADFYHALLGKEVVEINAYWARLKFSGKTQPPQQIGEVTTALDRVARDRNAIAYVDASKVDRRVKVVLKLER